MGLRSTIRVRACWHCLGNENWPLRLVSVEQTLPQLCELNERGDFSGLRVLKRSDMRFFVGWWHVNVEYKRPNTGEGHKRRGGSRLRTVGRWGFRPPESPSVFVPADALGPSLRQLCTGSGDAAVGICSAILFAVMRVLD